jgi:hypothetical protein
MRLTPYTASAIQLLAVPQGLLRDEGFIPQGVTQLEGGIGDKA